MALRCRRLTFSLRTLVVLLTALAVWLGVIVNRAREQQEAVNAIEALGGRVGYDWEMIDVPYRGDFAPPIMTNNRFITTTEPRGPSWLRRLIGDDYFQRVVFVAFGRFTPDSDVQKAVPALKRLPRLAFVHLPFRASVETKERIEIAIPKCDIVTW